MSHSRTRLLAQFALFPLLSSQLCCFFPLPWPLFRLRLGRVAPPTQANRPRLFFPSSFRESADLRVPRSRRRSLAVKARARETAGETRGGGRAGGKKGGGGGKRVGLPTVRVPTANRLLPCLPLLSRVGEPVGSPSWGVKLQSRASLGGGETRTGNSLTCMSSSLLSACWPALWAALSVSSARPVIKPQPRRYMGGLPVAVGGKKAKIQEHLKD